jgi:hypothetical protein
MAATAIASSTRYINPNTTVFYWVPAIASKAAPIRSELNAGTDITGELNAVDGFKTTSDQVETPDMATRFTSKIPGRISADDSSVTVYASVDGVDARALMPVDEDGFMVIMDGGDVPGSLMDVYPARVSSHGKERSTEGKDAALIEIMFSITSEPAENVVIPS